MKNKAIALSGLAGILIFSACAMHGAYSARGTVQNIERGKDGYTATLKDADGKEFDAVISIVKLQKNYRTLKAGDEVKLYGDTIHLDQRVRILVEKIK